MIQNALGPMLFWCFATSSNAINFYWKHNAFFDTFGVVLSKWPQTSPWTTGFIRFWGWGFPMCVLSINLMLFWCSGGPPSEQAACQLAGQPAGQGSDLISRRRPKHFFSLRSEKKSSFAAPISSRDLVFVLGMPSWTEENHQIELPSSGPDLDN